MEMVTLGPAFSAKYSFFAALKYAGSSSAARALIPDSMQPKHSARTASILTNFFMISSFYFVYAFKDKSLIENVQSQFPMFSQPTW